MIIVLPLSVKSMFKGLAIYILNCSYETQWFLDDINPNEWYGFFFVTIKIMNLRIDKWSFDNLSWSFDENCDFLGKIEKSGKFEYFPKC